MMPGDAFRFELVGYKELMDALDQLPTVAMKKTVVRNALKKAAEPIRDAARQNAQALPFDAQSIADSVTIGTLKKSQKPRRPADRTTVTRYVGPSHPLAHLFEFGTAHRYKKSGAYTGFIPAMPFLRTAWDANKKVAMNRLKEELWKSLEKSARMLAKKAERGTLTAKQKEGLLR
jgi:HK97 gp10 family phage protein